LKSVYPNPAKAAFMGLGRIVFTKKPLNFADGDKTK
jgi:hypothetical protein